LQLAVFLVAGARVVMLVVVVVVLVLLLVGLG
jgi:hypothetical protein